MVGIHVLINKKNLDKAIDHSLNQKIEKNNKITHCYSDEKTYINYTHYDGYPIRQIIDNDFVILIEGMIYNRDDEEVLNFCKSLGKNDREENTKRISDFTDKSDGEFIVFVFIKSKNEFIIFNDVLGRLPFYYFFDSVRFIAGRSTPFILHNMPTISVNKMALTQFLLTHYLTGSNTLIKDLKKMVPSEIVFIQSKSEETIECTSVITVDKKTFITENPFKTKKEAIDSLYADCKAGIINRIEKLSKENYNIINTISGGNDSRSVFGLINSITQDFTNVTYEYVQNRQDESNIAQQVLKETRSKSKFVKLSYDNEVDGLDSSLVYRTGCNVNAFTIATSYSGSLVMKNKISTSKDVLFKGFGGEFIRHPYPALPLNAIDFLCYGLPEVPVHKVAPIFGIRVADYKTFLNSTYCSKLQEKSQKDVYKHLYSEYYTNIVGAGEDRERLLFWTCQPLLSAFFIKTIRKRIPLEWANFKFFWDFLEKIEKKLIKVPLYKHLPDYSSKNLKSRIVKAIKNKKYIFILKFIGKKYFWKSYVKYIKEYGVSAAKYNAVNYDRFEYFLKKLDFYKNIFDLAYIKKEYNSWPFNFKCKLQTVAMYLFELEKNHRNKLQ